MITSFEVGAVFSIVNRASPTLTAILRQVRALNEQLDLARKNLATLATSSMSGVAAATSETGLLAKAWGDVATNARAANVAIGNAARKAFPGAATAAVPSLARNPAAPPFPFYIGEQAAARAMPSVARNPAAPVFPFYTGAQAAIPAAATILPSAAAAATGGAAAALPPAAAAALPTAAAPPTGGGGAAAAGGAAGGRGGGGRNRLGSYLAGGGGSSGVHITGPGAPIPGGGHISGGGAGMAAAGIAGYGVYEAAKMEDSVFQLMYHAGVEYNDANRQKFREIVQNGMRQGRGMHEVAEAATQAVRLMQGVPGNGVDVLPDLLKAASTEGRLKGTSMQSSMEAGLELAHMTKEYGPEAINKLMKDFAFLSIADPRSLKSMGRAASYSVPILQSGLEIDPMSSLLLGTALARSGAGNTKSGTWLRAMVERAMPGTAIFESEKKAEHHDELLKRIGLLDNDGHVTWKDEQGKLDPLKMLDIAREGLKKIPLEERAGVEHKLFGTQGEGAMSLLSDKAVGEQIKELDRMRKSPEWANRYGGFSQDYESNSTVQQARTAMAEFNITMMDLAKGALPAVKEALMDFKGALQFIRGLMPGGGESKAADTMIKRGLEGAVVGAGVGAVYGSFGGPVGAVGGAAVGGVLGAAQAYIQNEAAQKKQTAGERYEQRMKEHEEKRSEKAPEVKVQPFSVSLILDGRTLAQAMTSAMASPFGFAAQAPAADGMGQYFGGDHQSTDK